MLPIEKSKTVKIYAGHLNKTTINFENKHCIYSLTFLLMPRLTVKRIFSSSFFTLPPALSLRLFFGGGGGGGGRLFSPLIMHEDSSPGHKNLLDPTPGGEGARLSEISYNYDPVESVE